MFEVMQGEDEEAVLVGRRIQAVLDAVLAHAADSIAPSQRAGRAAFREMGEDARRLLHQEIRKLGLGEEFRVWLAGQSGILSARDTSVAEFTDLA
jgi:hypothetical protein